MQMDARLIADESSRKPTDSKRVQLQLIEEKITR